MRRTPLRARAHRVTAEEALVYVAVAERDQGCVAPRLDGAVDACRGRLHRQHVRPAPGARRTTALHLVLMLCEHHHLDGWATSKAALALQRAYLRQLYPAAWGVVRAC